MADGSCDCGHALDMHEPIEGQRGWRCGFLASGKSSPARRCACNAPTTSGVPRDNTFKPKRSAKAEA